MKSDRSKAALAMGRADGGGADDGGATAAELGEDDGRVLGSRARRCFVVVGLPRVVGRIGPSRVAPTPQDKPTTNQSETSLVSDTPWTKDQGGRFSGPTQWAPLLSAHWLILVYFRLRAVAPA